MKKIISILLCFLMLVGFTPQIYASNPSASNNNYDINMMSTLGLDTSKITDINHYKSHTKYKFNYDDYSETIDITRHQNSIKFLVSDRNISNEVVIFDNGDIYLDGNKVIYSSPKKASGWKRVYKGFSPYGSLTRASYSKFLSSGTQDIALGKTLDALTAGALLTILGYTNFWAGLTVSAGNTAASVYKTLKSANPKTTHLGCKYKTWIAGSADYQYICDYYANKRCTGKSKRVIIYEHFRVY